MPRSFDIPAWLLLGLLTACQPQATEPLSNADWREAPFPTVLRSVLDNQPRMISVRLADGLYAAYDAQACAPTKIWRGGLALNGAAYNNIKTVQPSSWGHTYWENPSAEAFWQIQAEDGLQEVRPVFKGYFLQNGLPVFQYELPAPLREEPLKVRESLAVSGEDDGGYRVERRYALDAPPAGLTLLIGGQAMEDGLLQVVHHLESMHVPAPPSQAVTAASGALWLDRSGCNTCHAMDEVTIGPSYRQIAARYDEADATLQSLTAKVKQGGQGAWGQVPMNAHPDLADSDIRRMIRYILSLDPDPRALSTSRAADPVSPPEPPDLPPPGFGAPLAGLHPALEATNLRPAGFRPRVGGMAFLPDGRLALCTWDSIGAVYLLDNVTSGHPDQVHIQRFAAGLHEPLGLEVVDGQIYVLQKQELTLLLDHDKNGVADEYRSLCNSFDASADFHEFSYGLAYHDGAFYATLGLAMRLMRNETQLPDRGTTIRMDTSGHYEIVNRGLRQPNGIGHGPEGELFVLENQGQWVPSSKLIHVRADDFHGCRFHDGGRFAGESMTPPAVWLPQDEIGNSPSEPVYLAEGPYAGQMLHGEVTHGGIKRVFLEKVDGAYQGAVFRFTQGLEAGINRLAWGPDGALYAGGVGMNGNWGWGNRQYSLERITFHDRPAFEMLSVRAQPDGLTITFTLPLAPGEGEDPDDYQLEQWHYEPTAQYGGPKLDHETLAVETVRLSDDRRRARLTLPDMEAGRVVYLRLDPDLQAESGQALWAGEAWYTLNAIPK